MNNRLLSLLGLARRAGRLSLGNDPAKEALQSGHARLILLAGDLSERSARGIRYTAEDYGVELIELKESMDEIGMALGKRSGILAVNDAGFAKKARQLIAQTNGEECNL